MSIGKPKYRDYIDSNTGKFDEESFCQDLDEYESIKELENDDERHDNDEK